MIIAVITVRMVKMPIDEIVDVISVRYRFVSTARTVYVIGIVSPADVIGCAVGRIGVADFQRVLFDLAVRADVMHVTVVQIVNVVAVLDTGVFTVRAVLVIVIGVNIGHVKAPYEGWTLPSRA